METFDSASEKGLTGEVLPDNEVFFSSGVEETEAYASSVAVKMNVDTKTRAFIALYGELGVGKTAFVRGFVSILIPSAPVRSPTYSIVNVYKNAHIRINHFDLYRVSSDDELEACGFYDCADEGITVCEWSENIPFALPAERIEVKIEKTDNGDGRKISLTKILPKNKR